MKLLKWTGLLGLLALLAVVPRADADVVVTAAHVTPQASASVETSQVVPGGVKSLHGASVTTGAAGGYFLILDAAADPGNGPVSPVKCIAVGANQTVGVTADTNTVWDFPAGIVLVFSTTGCFTETQSATAFFSWQ